MNRILIASLALLVSTSFHIPSAAAEEEAGFTNIFDGKTLKNWDGNPAFWSVQDGAITGQTTKENPTKGNTFIIWRGGTLGDFDLRLQFRIDGGNSGIQYRSKEVNKWVIGGYQADFDSAGGWTGTLYEERGRGVIARRGDAVKISAEGEKGRVAKTADEKDILASIKQKDWNDYRIVAQGNHLQQWVNGIKTIDVVDEQEAKRAMSGLLALQLHAGPPMTVQFKNIRLKKLTAADATGAKIEKKKIVFLAGTRSHGYGAHEHFAGCRLLAGALAKAYSDWDIQVIALGNQPSRKPGSEENLQVDVAPGWPATEKLADADCLIIYCDGGGRHPFNQHLEEVEALSAAGTGVVCLHYGVETTVNGNGSLDRNGEHFLKWIGGYFEPHYSVNPHWVAKYEELPNHPITRGVKPFEADDEWYYHMRFRPEMQGVTPILTTLPPDSTLSRPDGAHSGNPHVRKAIANKEPQHMAWASVREHGGRGFGFTGGHNHWNWGNDDYRKLVLNAIVWCTQSEVPKNGVTNQPVTFNDLEKNQDFDQKPNFNRDATARKFNLQASAKQIKKKGPAAKPIFQSKIVTPKTPGHAVDIDVDISGSKKLFLVVEDGGNGYGCDWACWMEPRLIGPRGEMKLTALKWQRASTDFGSVHVDKNVNGQPLRVGGKPVPFGIGTHARSIIAYDLPEGYTRFKARGGLDNGGTDQKACGNASSVQFVVFNKTPTLSQPGQPGSDSGSREPDSALANLDVHADLQATLFAAEPIMLNPTNIDIDHRGRAWVCEVINYRRFANKDAFREAGDCIVILEDTDQDGIADKRKVFYQDPSIDSAHGVCVLPTPNGKNTKVIVSAGEHVFVLTDTDGDDKADKREVLFQGISGTQHDHGIHAFVFGPDGKLYFNFGNSGRQIKDANGKLIVDQAGNQVTAARKPYQEGMVFRCNLDGSELETLGWNFRNNWEVAVDSFGTLWQSDNDDDGNRGVRINFVMEFGNYGYKDEKTGAGWKQERTGWHSEIPKRHWHLNDPGVVPNLLQTGAGSPTGICVYEGHLLPKTFQNQVIHSDAGPNVVRAYPVVNAGAGYAAEMVNVLHGARDKWFRPSSVDVAPDGSLIVADWYDPGVGGHRMGDTQRGRLFRVAPADSKYSVPKISVDSVEGAIAALKSPNTCVRSMAWTALHNMGQDAEAKLAAVYQTDDNPRYRARALWLLGKIEGRGQHWVNVALADKNPDLRIVGVRLARQLKLDLIPVVTQLVQDPSPQVRRELAIALRHNPSPKMPALWAQLASQHDGQDRWYLEALGIGSDLRTDACFSEWLKLAGKQWNTAGGRDIIWRSRSPQACDYLAKIIKSLPEKEHPRYMRAFDFHSGPEKEQALLSILGL